MCKILRESIGWLIFTINLIDSAIIEYLKTRPVHLKCQHHVYISVQIASFQHSSNYHLQINLKKKMYFIVIFLVLFIASCCNYCARESVFINTLKFNTVINSYNIPEHAYKIQFICILSF